MNLTRFAFIAALAAPLCSTLCVTSAFAQVTAERLLRSGAEPQNWLTYSGDYAGRRHSALNQINLQNVHDLELKWVFQAHSFEKFEATPIVVDGVLYTVQAPNDVVALDAATGRIFWTFNYTPSKAARVCCGRVNRGVAVADNLIFMGTLDAHLIALDAKSGKSVWNTTVGKPELGYALTHAPLVVKDKVIVGVAGGEYGIRGYIAAYDIHTGKEAWKFYTIPAAGEPGVETWAGDSWKHGGGSIWVTGAYDPALNLTYWGVGNPGPDWNGDTRKGDNLYSDSVVALDADTGKLKWYYQFSPHDEFDYDSVQVPVLADIELQGQPRKVMLWANRNGMYYTLDRVTGKFLVGKPFTQVNWANGFDEAGRPMRVAGKVPSREGTLIYPSNQGATNWYSPSFSPKTGLFYIPAWDDTFSIYVKADEEYKEGQRYSGGTHNSSFAMGGTPTNTRRPEDGHGAIIAIDPTTGEKKWKFNLTDVTDAGILTTDSDLLFSGSREQYFYALDARNGSLLWKTSLGGPIVNGPMTYSVNGKQMVAVNAGNSLYVFGLR